MPIKRDKQTKVLRDVPQRTLDRWPDDYQDLSDTEQTALDALRAAGVREATILGGALDGAIELAKAGHIATEVAATKTAEAVAIVGDAEPTAVAEPAETPEPAKPKRRGGRQTKEQAPEPAPDAPEGDDTKEAGSA